MMQRSNSRFADLEDCIDHRLLLLSIRHNLEINSVKANYVHRLNNLDYVVPSGYKSRCFAKAYEGTVKYYEQRVK